MGGVTGNRRTALTAGLFAAALAFLVVAIATHNAIPLFVMWLPLLAVPLVLGRADPTAEPPDDASMSRGDATGAEEKESRSENERS